jgi:hypothetical protein
VGAITSIAIGPVRPSPPSQRHPGHCINIPDVVGACGDRTPATVPHTASRQRRPRVLMRTAIEQATSAPPPSKAPLDAHRTRHDAPPDVRFARTAVYSATLYTMPLHVDEIVRHACKLSPPWPIKGGAVPQPQGEDGQPTLERFPLSPRYLHSPQSIPLGPGGLISSPASLVAPLCKHHGATQYSVPSTPLLDVRPPAETRIKPSVTNCLAPAIER